MRNLKSTAKLFGALFITLTSIGCATVESVPARDMVRDIDALYDRFEHVDVVVEAVHRTPDTVKLYVRPCVGSYGDEVPTNHQEPFACKASMDVIELGLLTGDKEARDYYYNQFNSLVEERSVVRIFTSQSDRGGNVLCVIGCYSLKAIAVWDPVMEQNRYEILRSYQPILSGRFIAWLAIRAAGAAM